MQDNVKDIVVSVMFILIIFGFSISCVVAKDNEISNTERRKLKQFSSLSLESLLEGKITDEFETYVMDQFILRDNFRSVKTFVKLNVLCQKENNGFFKINNSIYNLNYPLSTQYVLNTANKINEAYDSFLDETNDVYYCVVPDKNYYLDEESDYLKIDYSKMNELLKENINKNIKYIDIYDTVNSESYYDTDTHWSQDKILPTATKIANEMGFNIDENILELKEYNKFYGTYYSQLADGSIKEDTIKYYTSDIIENAKVYNFETKKETSVYDEDKFENSMDKYEFFLSGSTPLLKITNDKAKEEKTLVVFRDSFSSSLVPLFIEAYSTIYLVDTRYIAPQLLNDYMEFKNADVLFIYSTLVINESGSLK